MRQLARLLAGLLLCRGALALASTLLSEGGFIPPDAPNGPITKCETTTDKNAAKAFQCVIKCHKSRVAGAISDETACESNNGGKSCLEKFASSEAKVKQCPPCLDVTALSEMIRNQFDTNQNPIDFAYYNLSQVVYCSGTVPFDANDRGFIPADAPKGPIAKCENKLAMSLAALFPGIANCHKNRAHGTLADDLAEKVCEGSVGARKFDSRADGCDDCTFQEGRSPFIEGASVVQDSLSASIYCASPSGAFPN